MKLIKRIGIGFIILYILASISVFVLDYRVFGTKLIKLHPHLQVVTGPSFYIDKKERKKIDKLLKEKYPNINTSEIELVGNLPYNSVDDPAKIGDITVYGTFIGTTDLYEICGDGIIPVFKVKYYDEMPFLFLEDRNRSTAKILVYILPVFTLVIIVFLVNKMLRKESGS